MRSLFCLLALALCSRVSIARPVSYRKQIAPIFAASCNACHSVKTPQSGLSTGVYAALMKGGTRGRAIIPSNAEDSLLVQYIEGRRQPRMPVGGALSPDEIATIRRWIAEGAKSDGEASASPSPARIALRANVLPQAASLAWSKDGRLLAVGTYREVKLFDVEGRRLQRTLPGHADVVHALAFSPDGATLAAAGGVPGQDGEIKLWNVDGGALLQTMRGHTDCIYGLAWRPDGKQLATASYDKTVKLWDAVQGAAVADLKEHADAVYAVAYSPNGKWLATCGADRSIRVWDAATGRWLYTLAGHTDVVTALAFHPTADRLVSAGADKTVRLWSLRADGGDSAKVFPAQPDVVTDVRFSPDGKMIATAGNDGVVRLWDTAKGEVVRALPAGGDAVLALAFRPNGRMLAAGGYDGSVTLFNVADGTRAALLIAAPKHTAQGR